MAILRWTGSLRSALSDSWAASINDPDAAQKATQFIDNPSSLFERTESATQHAHITNSVQNSVTATPEALKAILNLLRDLLKDDANSAGGTTTTTLFCAASNSCKHAVVHLGG
jgi:hypothetical protein